MSEPAAQLKELEWFKCYPDRLLSSVRWQNMKDFQRGWYWHLLLLMTRSKPLGYLPLDGRLWALAGACSKQYWDNQSELVLSAFKVAEFDGQRWIYSEKMLDALNQRTWDHDNSVKNGRLGGRIKRTRSIASLKYSLEFERTWEEKTWKCVGKSKAYKAYEKALVIIQEEKNCARDEAIAQLADAMEEFKTSPAGRDGGLFDTYTAPHPASWLNAQRYFDDRRTWRVLRGTADLARNPAAENGRAGSTTSFADKNCPKCRGEGWDCSSGKAVRCECKAAKAMAANGTA